MVSVERGIIYSSQTKLQSDEPSTLTLQRKDGEKQQQQVFFFPFFFFFFFLCTSADSRGLLEACQSKQISATAPNKQATVEPSEDE